MKKRGIDINTAADWVKEGKITGSDADWINEQTGKHLKKIRAKFRNEKVEYDGKVFDSKKEYQRYRELLLLLKSGKIGMLKCQVPFLLVEKTDTTRAVKYIADFTYLDSETGQIIVEDVKSPATRKLSTYIIKKKLMKTVHNIDIKEI